MTTTVGKKVVVIGLLVVILISLALAFAISADAATINPGEKAATWIMDQVFWIALAVIAVVAVTFIIKRAWVPLVIFAILSAIVLVIVSSPERLQNIGEALFVILGL